jgi:hypothetical protein
MSSAPRSHRILDYRPSVRSKVRITLAALLLLCGLAACTGDEKGRPLIEDYVTGVQVLEPSGATDSVVDQQMEPGSDEGPAAEIAGNATVVNGGSIQQAVVSTQPFTKLRLGVEPVQVTPTATAGQPEPPTRGASGIPVRGYREVTLPEPTTTANLVITLAQHLPGDGFDFFVALVDPDGKQGKLARQQISIIQVGTGDVQVTVSWDGDSDVDLHVVDPNGDEVFYNNSPVPSGGNLDLDSNADCDIDHRRNENITWARAPAGRYTVRVDLYKSCGVASTHYVVTVQVVGQPTRTFTGTFGGTGDLGGLGGGQEVTTFEVTSTPS